MTEGRDITSQEVLRSAAREVAELQVGDGPGLYSSLKRAEMLFNRIFGPDNNYSAALPYISFLPSVSPSTPEKKEHQWRGGAMRFSGLLTTAADELDLFGDRVVSFRGQASARLLTSRRVFIVHGHDDGLKEMVARVLSTLELEPVILHEQPNKGRTIIEKFEDYTDVSFAVVLLTPDDMGYVATAKSNSARPRARQNVVLELGFFIGRIGRQRVVALHSESAGFERPSDYDGVLFIPVDGAANWRFELAKELQSAGIEVDANKLLKPPSSAR